MRIERSLQVNMALLSVTSTLLYGMGQRDALLPGLVMTAAVVSIWLTDAKGWFRLNRAVASILAVVAFLTVAREMLSWDNVVLIRAIARMLVYLQMILLFQRKDHRVYWQLIVLSLLLVVVATVFNQGALFGLLMVAYLYMAISSMTLLFLHHEAGRYASAESPLPGRAEATAARLWPLAAEASVAAGDVTRPPEERGCASRDFLRRLVSMGLGTLGFTAVVFFILPRLGQPAWRSPFHQQRRMVGYSGQVELGELGRVLEDPAEVLRIGLTDPATGRMYPVDGAIYLHGTVLTQYADRRWTLPHGSDSVYRLRATRRPPPGEDVAQTITIEPMDRPEVFCVQPFYSLKRQPALLFDPNRGSLLRALELCSERCHFRLRTNAFRKGHQKSLVPAPTKPPNLGPLLQLPSDQLPTLVDLAERWMAEPAWAGRGRIDRARYLESKLRNSDRFQYSMKPRGQTSTIDPIEDFVKDNPQGHCEYFSTTLALMLRSQGIPSRLVVGYKCDEFNPLGKFFQVRQLHAHTWVEVYLPPEEVPRYEQIGGGERTWAGGAWLRLDPTPGTGSEQLGAAGRALATVGKGIDWLEYLWNNYIMEMDRSRQRQAVYRPLVDWAKGAYERLTSRQWWKETSRQVLQVVNPANWRIEKWFSWRGGLVAMGVCFVLVVVYRAARYVVRRCRNWLSRRRRRAVEASRARVEFYQQFLSLLRCQGIRRPLGQTQREFARSVGRHLAAQPARSELAGLPERIADAFYEVRFGGHPLDKAQRQEVEQALARLEAAFDRRRRAGQREKETTAL